MSEDQSRAATLVDEYLSNLPEWTSDEYAETARDMARNAELNEPINRAPSSIAAGAIYGAGLIVNEKRTQAEVIAACDVSEPTLRKAYTEILEADGYEIEPDSSPGRTPGPIVRLRRTAESLFSGGESR